MNLRRNCAVLVLLLVLAAPAWGRPPDQSRGFPKIQQGDANGRNTDGFPTNRGVMSVATAGTTFYGGTFWAADSMRWEAYENQLWTFDTGVGSSIVPPGGPDSLSAPTSTWVNPYKPPGHHATMEGWIGFDYSPPTWTGDGGARQMTPHFRRVGANDSRWDSVCVGSEVGLGGNYSFWAGVFSEEADSLCYVAGQGYGNGWSVCIERSFAYGGGNVTLNFLYRNDTEDRFDYTFVYCDTTGDGDVVEIVQYTGPVSGVASLPLTPGIELPRVPKPIKIKFCLTSDGAWSDQDGLYPTGCGAFAVDNIVLSGAISHEATFETSADGWELAIPPPGLGGEWSNIYSLNDLPPPLAPCACALSDSVLAFPDVSGFYKHNNYKNNLAASPWIDLKSYDKVGSFGKIIKTNIYADLPLLNYIFAQFNAQWYPEQCLQTGKLVTSPWTSNGFVYYFGGVPQCTSILPGTLGTQIDFSAIIPPGAEQVRIALGVLSYCRFFGGCTQVSNTSPWFDNAGLGVYGDPSIPFIVAEESGRAQDNFPENGTLNLFATARVDGSSIQGASQPEIGTTMGDTLVVKGAVGNAEVYVHFRAMPGPGTHPSRLQAWLRQHAISPIDAEFRMARLDTAEFGTSGPINGSWMTAYHESDPNFWGTDRTTDPNDITPTGGAWRLDNDIFPDDLLTAGSRLEYFFSANNVGESSFIRDPASGYYEMEILPSSMTPQRTWNCVLYVDHANRGVQPYIENALSSILGTGSENPEGTHWDRYDVNAASSQQGSFGRPLQTDYGATLVQALGYRSILWDSGNLNAFSLIKEDADVLLPWLTFTGLGEHNLYLSGDGIVYSAIREAASEPSAAQLVRDLAAVTIRATCSLGNFRNSGCPTSLAPQDLTPCVDVDPVSNSPVANHPARTISHMGQGNGCPELRSFDVLALLTPESGTVAGDEDYASVVKSASHASAVTNAPGRYKIVTDGLSVAHRRDAGTACDYVLGGTTAVAERLNEVLGYFGYASQSNPLCSDPTLAVGLPPEETPEARIRTSLAEFSPNPLAAGREGRIRFTLEYAGQAKVEIFNLEGRLVRTVFEGQAQGGINELSWNGTDLTGHPVASGVYYLRLQTESADLSRRVVILKVHSSIKRIP